MILKLVSRDKRTQNAGIKQYEKSSEKLKQQLPIRQRLEAKQQEQLIAIKTEKCYQTYR